MANITASDDLRKLFKYILKIWLDIDDTIFDSSPLIQYYVDRFFPLYSEKNLKVKQRNLALWKYYYEQMAALLAEAERLKITPDMRMFNQIIYPQGQDDIIRTAERKKYESIVDTDDKTFKLYREPLLIVGQSVRDAQKDLDWFYELRTACLEDDGKKEHGDIPYELIYREKNLLPYAKENLIALYNIFGSLVACLTAHNGIDDTHGREFEAKTEAIKRIVKGIDVRGIRFKPEEFDIHNIDIRERSFKTKVMRAEFGLEPDEPITGQLGVDDSLFNNDDIYREGGVPIWLIPKNIATREAALQLNRSNYAKMFEPNADPKKVKYAYAMARSIRPESLIREFHELHLDEPDPAKVLRKKMVA